MTVNGQLSYGQKSITIGFVYTEQDLETKAMVRGEKFSTDDQGEVQLLLGQQPGV